MEDRWYSEVERVLESDAERQQFFAFCEHISATQFHRAEDLLNSVPFIQRDSYLPICRLFMLIYAFPAQWPVFKLLRCYSDAWKSLPEAAKRPSDPGEDLTRRVAEQVKAMTGNHLNLLQAKSSRPAIFDPINNYHIDHRTLHKIVRKFSLPVRRSGPRKPVVAIALPNGALLAVTTLAVSAYYTAVPLSTSGGHDFRRDISSCGADTLLVSQADVDKLGLCEPWILDAGIQVLTVELDVARAVLSLRTLEGSPLLVRNSPAPNTGHDCAVLLFTSGTSGNKKLVPLTQFSLVSGAIFVMESWNLTSADVCLNMMPLNHVGGLIRNLFAPLFAGGSTVCCSAFDPNLFWDVLAELRPTWYYASPSMHSAILDAGDDRTDATAHSRIRFIANAAGGLLPSLAASLRERFQCTVLPSFGMTECQPISSPPLDYRLDRPGTSGVTVGPEISILDGNDQSLAPHAIGRISVRGPPVFPGYCKKGGKLDRSAFNVAGWFDTGDLGYLDEAGYLYITGRSKEVINRGGEIVSPFEVEEAIVAAAQDAKSPIFGRVSQALTFSIPHRVLQEVVAVVLVTPQGSRRADIRGLQEALRPFLQPVKVPVLIVFMDALPKRNNKVLRIGLSERLKLAEISDDLPTAARHLEAICPPPDTELKRPIQNWPCQVDIDELTRCARNILGLNTDILFLRNAQSGLPECISAPAQLGTKVPGHVWANLQHGMKAQVDGYAYPSSFHCLDEPFPLTDQGVLDEIMVHSMITKMSRSMEMQDGTSPTKRDVAQMFEDILGCPGPTLAADSDFFELGGDSLRAGKLLSLIRKCFEVRLPIDTLFTHSRIGSLADIIDTRIKRGALTQIKRKPLPPSLPGCKKTHSSTNPWLLVFQLLPVVVFYPMKRAFIWTVWMYLETCTEYLPTNDSTAGRLLNLIVSLGIARAVTALIAPLVAIVAKWVIIQRYREGMYPMWGVYHTRWWMVQKMLSISGLGLFDMFDGTRVLFYRSLGAKIGKNVSISSGVSLGEYDLITIGDDVTLDKCFCRPFAAERNTSMYLGRITIGHGCSVGLTSQVAAGTHVPARSRLGSNSSSWEVTPSTECNRGLNIHRKAKTHWLLTALVTPIVGLARFLKALPWMGGLVGLVMVMPGEADSFSAELGEVLHWFASPHRLIFHYLAVILNALLAPIVLFFFAALLTVILNATIGRTPLGPVESRTQMQHFRKAVMDAVLPGKQLHKFTELFGQHYEVSSMALRALGARIGARVYWPGTGPSLQDYELLNIGDDVVFGSRAHLITSDDIGSEPIRVGNGAMISDRVVVLPGVELGNRTIMGTGALTKRTTQYPSDTTWVGSKDGDAIRLTKQSWRDPGTSEAMQGSFPTRTSSLNGQTAVATDDLRIAGLEGKSVERTPQLISGSSTLSPPSTRTRADSADSMETLTPQGQGYYQTSPSLAPDAVKGTPDSASPYSRSDSPMGHFVDDADDQKQLLSKKHPAESSPFGRAFYSHQAPYYVLRLWQIIAYTLFTTAFVAFFWNIASTTAIVVVSDLLNTDPEFFLPIPSLEVFRPILLYLCVAAVTSVIMTAQALFALVFVIASKWVLLDRRQPGSYDWDKSSYCQRWQVFLTIEKLRRRCYGGQGILGLLTGTHYMTLYFRALGGKIGKDCCLFASGLPSLMFTEPDLLELGERVAVDDASLVSHINTRGHFNLNRLSVGDRSVLRSGSRLLSGARMEADACLVEHTLVMAGDVVEEGETRQGWPCEDFKGERVFLGRAGVGGGENGVSVGDGQGEEKPSPPRNRLTRAYTTRNMV